MRLTKNDQDFFAVFEKRASRNFRKVFIANLILIPLYLGMLAAFIVGVVWGVVKVLQVTGVL